MLAGEFYYTEMITQKLRASFFSLRRRRERESTAAELSLPFKRRHCSCWTENAKRTTEWVNGIAGCKRKLLKRRSEERREREREQMGCWENDWGFPSTGRNFSFQSILGRRMVRARSAIYYEGEACMAGPLFAVGPWGCVLWPSSWPKEQLSVLSQQSIPIPIKVCHGAKDIHRRIKVELIILICYLLIDTVIYAKSIAIVLQNTK